MQYSNVDSSTWYGKDRYNGQVYFVPTTSWQLAIWAIIRSTRLVAVENPERLDLATFTQFYNVRNHSPILWYTPQGALGDEIYDFLHRLPELGRVILLCEEEGSGFPKLDRRNIQALLDERWESQQVPSFLGKQDKCEKSSSMLPETVFFQLLENSVPTYFSKEYYEQIDFCLDLHHRLDKKSVHDKQLSLPLPKILILVSSTPYLACTVAPLAAYVQATLLYFNPQRANREQFLTELVNVVLEQDTLDEIWLVGNATQVKDELENKIQQEIIKRQRFVRIITVRSIGGTDHFTVSEQSAILLLTYRYFDWILLQTLKHDKKREFFFEFLASTSMHNLHCYCNRVLDLADQLQYENFDALKDVHHLYWSLSVEERRQFIKCFQDTYSNLPIVSNSLAVIADYIPEEPVPYHVLDAAAYAARRSVPLLLLQSLPAETNYYVSSLIDKIDEQLVNITDLQVKHNSLAKERDDLRYKLAPIESNSLLQTENGQGTQLVELEIKDIEKKWRTLETSIEHLIAQEKALRETLQNNLYKTGEVLYESLVPLAVRKVLSQLCPTFLAAFIQDPSLPIELIREPDSSLQNSANGFWSLKYAIGHISSVNPYETNLINNISFFTPRKRIRDSVQVLLCSNPTRDLYFSSQEAQKIEYLLKTQVTKIGEAQSIQLNGLTDKQSEHPSIRHLRYAVHASDLPTRENFVSELRKGFDIVHYSGHAFFDNVLPGRSGLILSEGSILTAADIRFILDLNSNPIIYTNACSAGRIKSVSSRFMGLASAFIRAGASCYISALWSVDDLDASDLAAEFYQALLSGHHSVGESLRLAKQAQVTLGSVTWASLVLYGDPTVSIFQPD
ncbi:CHAT domain-containing protein [Nostoc favosum]|uniref:CHAT domain-containing protein n=1 Tax=Nostoc favosum CHAB5714 TaxID=2780399 RepID=A0ABS8I940_9NOSO|nr:CHAT domain-containing protein [Nostoc favosum]MCC5600633.1 CHAT domain-containing protein [Nostoc favosum CHAB5714]